MPLGKNPPLPMMLLNVWHPLAPDGCKGCGTRRHPHFARLLCHNCYRSASASRILERYPTLPEPRIPLRVAHPGTTAGMHTPRAQVRRQRRDAAWARQRAIRDHLARFITDEAQDGVRAA